MTVTVKDIERSFKLALVETYTSQKDVHSQITEWKNYEISAIIVSQPYVIIAKELMKNTNFNLGMIVGYPLGSFTTETKVELTKYAVRNGVDEINLALNYNAVKSGDYATVKKDLIAVIKAADDKLNVIPIPMVAKMTLDEIYKLCKLFVEVGCTRVKTNSGMNYKGETMLGVTEVEHVQFIKRNFPELHIEASAGIFTMEKAKAVLNAGAENIHTIAWKACMGI